MASALIDRILADITVAMKAREKDKLAALRLLNAEIKNVAINERRDVTDEDAATYLEYIETILIPALEGGS